MAVIKKKKKSDNGCAGMKNVIGQIGDNCVVQNCPVLIPKQNIETFNMFKNGSDTTNSFGQFPNPFDNWNKK